MWIFLGAIAVVALLGADSDLRPSFGGKPLSMVLVIQMFMLLTGALIIILTKNQSRVYLTKRSLPFRYDRHRGGVRYRIGWQKPCSVRICLKFRAYWVKW